MQRQKQELLSISQYARLRGMNKSTISRQVRAGVIPTRNGRIDPVQADEARLRHLDPSKSAAAAMRKEDKRRAAGTGQASETATTACEVLVSISAWAERLPELFRAMGAPFPVALASIDVLFGLLYFGHSDAAVLDYPIGAPDLAAVARRIGEPESELQALSESPAYEAWSDAISEFFKGNADYADGMEPLS